VQSLHKLAERHPDQVLAFVTDALKAGDEAEQERIRQQVPFGFRAAQSVP
jgi:hypothetical protein